MENITIDDFKKIRAQIGKVLKAEEIEGSDKLIRFEIDFGLKPAKGDLLEHSDPQNVVGEERDIRIILSGIKKYYPDMNVLVDKQMLFCTNLEPRPMMGIESHGMLMAVDGLDGSPVFLVPESDVSNGSVVR